MVTGHLNNPGKCQLTLWLSFVIYTLRVRMILTEMCDDSYSENNPESGLKEHFHYCSLLTNPLQCQTFAN